MKNGSTHSTPSCQKLKMQAGANLRCRRAPTHKPPRRRFSSFLSKTLQKTPIARARAHIRSPSIRREFSVVHNTNAHPPTMMHSAVASTTTRVAAAPRAVRRDRIVAASSTSSSLSRRQCKVGASSSTASLRLGGATIVSRSTAAAVRRVCGRGASLLVRAAADGDDATAPSTISALDALLGTTPTPEPEPEPSKPAAPEPAPTTTAADAAAPAAVAPIPASEGYAKLDSVLAGLALLRSPITLLLFNHCASNTHSNR